MRLIFITLLALLPLNAEAAELSEAELLEAVQTYTPNHYDKLIALRDSDPEAYEAALEKVSEKVLAQKTEKAEYKEELAKIKVQFQELAAQHAAAQPQQQEELREEMRLLAEEYFEMNQRAKRMRLEAIQAKAVRMEGQLERQESRRDQIIERYIEAALKTEDW
jgi:hypothetical protein